MTVSGATNIGKSMDDVSIPVSQRTTTRDLGQQDFLKIMIEQLRGQNPLDGGGDSNQFFAQMVQFQSLDAMTGMRKAIDHLSEVSGLANASAMIGKTVTATMPEDNDPDTGMPRPDRVVSGQVTSVVMTDHGAILNLEGNLSVEASAVAVIA